MIRRGVPSALIVTEVFLGLARSEARAMGFPQLPIIVIPHPLGIQGEDIVAQYALQALAQLIDIPSHEPVSQER